MITVFIGTTNRLSTLQRTVESYRHLTGEHELVLVDNGTDHPACVKLLDRLEKHVKKIYRLPACDSMEEATDNFNVAIRDQYDTDGGEWFAVSEADVSFDDADPESLNAYTTLAKLLKTAVGPHLRVDEGIPACYPLRSRVLACESRLLYRKEMAWYEGIPFTKCQTDTTFHLFPRTRRFNRLHLDPVRVGPPYAAKHLDWYLDITNPVKENAIYISGPRQVGSWGKQWIRGFWFEYQKNGAEAAFQFLMDEPTDTTDLCNNSFMRSWCYQYGVGAWKDLELSEFWLQQAIPYPHDHYWPYEENWKAMIYENDFTSLGWK